jgi:hypothetical protein
MSQLRDVFRGKENYCDKLVCSGLQVNGTYQQYITSPARYTTRIPDGISDYVAAPIMCSASTMLSSLLESQLKPGQWAVFIGKDIFLEISRTLKLIDPKVAEAVLEFKVFSSPGQWV